MLYFSHCVKDYDTEIEKKILDGLAKNGIAVFNPNEPKNQANYENKKMKNSEKNILLCDKFAYLPIPGNRVTAGVFHEIILAISSGIPVFRIDRDTLKFEGLVEFTDKALTIEETVDYISGRE